MDMLFTGKEKEGKTQEHMEQRHRDRNVEKRPLQGGIFFLFFSAFPARSLGFTILGVRFFAYVAAFLKSNHEVVTFRLCGWCMPGCVFVTGIHPSRI